WRREPADEGLGRPVVVPDVGGDVTAGEGPAGLVAVGGQPLPIRLHPLPGVDRGERRGDPTRLEGVGGVCPGADLAEAELLPRLEDRRFDLGAFLVGTPDLDTRLAGHAMPEGGDFPPG